jgi:hypothetical protein
VAERRLKNSILPVTFHKIMNSVTATMVSVPTTRFSAGGILSKTFFHFYGEVERHDTERKEGGLQTSKTGKSYNQEKNLIHSVQGGASHHPARQHRAGPVGK